MSGGSRALSTPMYAIWICECVYVYGIRIIMCAYNPHACRYTHEFIKPTVRHVRGETHSKLAEASKTKAKQIEQQQATTTKTHITHHHLQPHAYENVYIQRLYFIGVYILCVCVSVSVSVSVPLTLYLMEPLCWRVNGIQRSFYSPYKCFVIREWVCVCGFLLFLMFFSCVCRVCMLKRRNKVEKERRW